MISSSPPPSTSSRKQKSPLKRKRAPEPPSDSDDSDTTSESSDSEVETVAKSEPGTGELDGAEDEPVLSHAAKRKQKKKLKLDPSSSVPPSEPVTTPKLGPKIQRLKEEGKSQDTGKPKRQNSVWVGNLSFKTTEDALRRFFDGAGEVTRIHMPSKAVGPQRGKFGMKENRGFAYVDFVTEEAKKNAIVMSEGHLDGRKLLIKDGDDYTGRPAPTATTTTTTESSDPTSKSKPNPSTLTGYSRTAQKILGAQTQPPAQTLFFGNLGFETTAESLRGMLEAHRKGGKGEVDGDGDVEMGEGEGAGKEKKDGWIRKVRMGTFEDSGLCKGWAFVDFTSIEHATAALTHPRNHHMDGRKLKVEYASPDAVRRGGGPGARPERSKQPRNNQDKSRPRSQAGHEPRPQATDDVGEHSKAEGADAGTGAEEPPRKRQSGDGERVRLDRKGKPRAKPGAALAAAQREQAAIVPSQGKKITFD